MRALTRHTPVGTELPSLSPGRISRTVLALYAGASGDHNPMHIDLDFARASGMDDVFAHGMLSMAYLGRALTAWVPQERIRSFTVRFTAITPVLAEPTCTGRVTSVDTPEGDETLARIEVVAALADGTVTLRGEAVVSVD